MCGQDLEMPEPQEKPEWIPEWYPWVPPAAARPQTPSAQSSQSNNGNVDQFNVNRRKTYYVVPSASRMVKRELKGIHLFMITVNGTLGTGLYWRGGQILELAGPLAVPLSFFIVGLLGWAVMQCITEMLCIWPIPGALSVYVSEFVDPELGIAVGIAYWFTYSVSFGALIATLAAEVHFWTDTNGTNGNKVIDGLVIYTAVPIVLAVINSVGIKFYGQLEVIFGTVKITCLVLIAVLLIAINTGAGGQEYIGGQYWSPLIVFDDKAAKHWVIAFLMSLSLATFAYVGVEIIAASALESAPYLKPTRGRSDSSIESDLPRRSTLIGRTVKFSSLYISVLATISYSVSGLLVAFDIQWTHCSLPRLSWIKDQRPCYPRTNTTEENTASAFVAIAAESGFRYLGNAFNAFLMFTCVTCASTNLYVASRMLFGLTSLLDGGKGEAWHLRLLAWFGHTNSHKVPVRAMVFSAAAFVWVPFLQLSGGTTTATPIGRLVEILAQMGSVPVVIVWTCEVLAFIRYYRCIYRHRMVLEAQRIPQVRRFWDNDENDYPYRGFLQPYLAMAALVGCLFILIVANGASLWGGFYKFPFLSSYLIVLLFIGVWILLKLVRGGKWALVDLSNPNRVVRKLNKLHELRLAAT